MSAVLDRKKVVAWLDNHMIESQTNYRDCEHNVGWADRYQGELDVLCEFMTAMWKDTFSVEDSDV